MSRIVLEFGQKQVKKKRANSGINVIYGRGELVPGCNTLANRKNKETKRKNTIIIQPHNRNRKNILFGITLNQHEKRVFGKVRWHFDKTYL